VARIFIVVGRCKFLRGPEASPSGLDRKRSYTTSGVNGPAFAIDVPNQPTLLQVVVTNAISVEMSEEFGVASVGSQKMSEADLW
jgi:hypothetical protein